MESSTLRMCNFFHTSYRNIVQWYFKNKICIMKQYLLQTTFEFELLEFMYSHVDLKCSVLRFFQINHYIAHCIFPTRYHLNK